MTTRQLPPSNATYDDATAWWPRRAVWLYACLSEGWLPDESGPKGNRDATVSLQRLGSLPLPDGRLVANDPYLMGDEPDPIDRTLDAGPYDVLIAQVTPGGRTAAAMLVGSGGPIESWEMARWPGQDLATVTGEDFFGYGVDAGAGCFAGVEGARAAGRVLALDGGMLEDPISAAMFGADAGPSGAVFMSAEPGAPPIAVFNSGWGDGVYPTWFGCDTNGCVVVAVTDFLLTDDPFMASVDGAAGR